MGTKSLVRVRTRTIKEIDERFIAAWLSLEAKSICPNVYLSPHFVLPAVEHLPHQAPIIITVEEEIDGRLEILGLGIFDDAARTKHIPYRHLRAYRSPHSYLSGVLVTKDRFQETMADLGEFLRRNWMRWCGMEFLTKAEERENPDELEQVAGLQWHEYGRERRAVLNKSTAGKEYISQILSGRRKKALRRAYRFLQQHGEVHWRLLRSTDWVRAAQQFLHLEHNGWKGNTLSSLRADPRHEAFFWEVVKRLAADGRVFFTELMLGDNVIASSVNFISGRQGFAFKIGWDSAFAPGSPGLLNEVEFATNFQTELPEIESVDSGATPGSFIELLWSDKRYLSSGFYASSTLGSALALCANGVRKLRSKWRGWPPEPESVGAICYLLSW